ncbi:MAG TPA: LutB/LldF family L-lactate oxidation iron-sulfur protein [bacterium]|nr:LutB/LldF family L-lactate oxidation iron-sulfur protein [bacterium]
MKKEIGFKDRAARAALDLSLEAKFKMVANRHGNIRKFRMAELGNFEERRDQLRDLKDRILADHDRYLAKLQEQVEKLGGKVHLAHDAAAARSIITGIAVAGGVKIAVKGKSMTSEEIALTPALEQAGIEVLETDLGEYIIQLANERPSHIVTPAIHKSRSEIARLFADKLGMEYTDDPARLTMKAREVLREKFLVADLGITGANALIVENGTVVLLENEGNIRLSTTQPRIHVALAGIEKLLPAMDDVPLFLSLLPRSATGQRLSTYVSMIRGPARPDEKDGPREFHLVLLDNGRSRMRRDPVLRHALRCIRCGACANACPVYQHIGGHAYGSVYPGPIGAMITQALATGDEGWLLPFASSLCGACTEVCPVGIPIHKILIELRRRASDRDRRGPVPERMAFRAWSELWSRPAGYKLTALAASSARLISGGAMLHRLPPPGSAWTKDRDFPAPSATPFRKRWNTLAAEQSGPAARITATPSAPAGASELKKDVAPPPPHAMPRPGDPQRLVTEINVNQGKAFFAEGLPQARDKLKELLAPFRGQSLVRWDHPDLELIGVDRMAEEAGVTVTDVAAADRERFKAAAADAAVGVTAADFGVADIGVLALLTAPGHERSLSLLPPAHIALIRAGRALQSMEDLVAALRKIGEFRGLTLISGPSMTGDIEMMPVFGVHGPGKLFVIVWTE